MCQQFPEQGRSEDAELGTAVHWVGSEALEGKPMPVPGAVSPNGIVITLEMVECAGVYVQAAIQGAQGAAIYAVEQHMVISRVHPECHGTPDLRYWLPTPNELHVWDYKNGFGIVEPYENWQLICYAAGAIDEVAAFTGQEVGILDQHLTVVLHIVQPRPFHALGPIREWRVKASDLRAHINRLTHSATLALQQQAACTSGEHCRYCNGRRGCPTLQHAAMIAVDYTCSTSACQLSPAALAIELRTLQRCAELVKARLTGMEQQAMGIIKSGTSVPGFVLEVGKGRPVWKKPVGEVLALGQMLGKNFAAPQEAVTPAVAKRMGLDDELLALYSETPSNGFKLVPNDKSRIASVFGSQAT
jgi:hypothetical protein